MFRSRARYADRSTQTIAFVLFEFMRSGLREKKIAADDLFASVFWFFFESRASCPPTQLCAWVIRPDTQSLALLY